MTQHDVAAAALDVAHAAVMRALREAFLALGSSSADQVARSDAHEVERRLNSLSAHIRRGK